MVDFFKKALNVLLRRKYKMSFSQSGEDMILNTILCSVKKGFFVDVGANNPWIQSNTCFFYKKGWRGINIDALPGSMNVFKKVRKRDINLEYAISDSEQELTYYMFKPSFYNSFNKETKNVHPDKFIGSKQIKTVRLDLVLDKYLPNCPIDFMSVDVEGLDFNVLNSNNWERYRPKIVLIEHKAFKANINDTEIGKFLVERGYTPYCYSPSNVFFLENGFMRERYNLTK